MRVVVRFLLAACVAMLSMLAQAQTGRLAQTAAAMQPGEWRVVDQGGDASGFNYALLSTGSDNIFNYADKGLWNPNTREIQFLGKGCCGQLFKFITYTESTDHWVQEPKPYWDCSPSDTCRGHGFEHSTIDPATGNVYWRQSASDTIYKWTRATKTWSLLPTAPNPTVAVGIEWFPELGGFVLAGSGQLHLYRESTGKWTQLASNLPMGDYHNVASYNPIHHVVIFGGGNGSSNLYKLDSSLKITPIQNAPVNVGILASVFTVDPASGRHLLLSSAGSAYQYDVPSNTWSTVNTSGMPPEFWTPDPDKILFRIGVPISSYGVIAFLTTWYGSDSGTRLYLYKHASGGTVVPPDTTPPAPPTGLSVQ